MAWSIESDDVRGVCGQGSYPLITAMYNAIKAGSGGSVNKLVFFFHFLSQINGIFRF